MSENIEPLSFKSFETEYEKTKVDGKKNDINLCLLKT